MKHKLLITTLALASASAFGMNFKAELQPLRLPLMLSTSQPPKVKFTPPGEISVGLQRMCGDGDVAHFEQEHTEFEFVPQSTKDLHVLIGYWVVEEGASPVPNPANFFPVGYRLSPIAEQANEVVYKGDFLPMNKSFSPGPNGLNIIATDIINLQKIAEKSYGSNKNYRIFAGASTCVSPDQASTLAAPNSSGFKYTPSPVEIGYVLSTEGSAGLLKEAEYTVTNELDVDVEAKVDVFATKNANLDYDINSGSETIYKGSGYEATNQKPLKFGYKPGLADVDITGEKTFDIFKKVAKLSYPNLSTLPPTATDADKLQKYKDDLKAAGVYSQLTNSPNAGYCTSMNLSVNQNGPQYKWETFPMNLSCKYLIRDGQLASHYNALFSPSSLPSENDFNDLKKKLAARYFVAATFEATQKKMHTDTDLKIEKPNCYNVAGKPMINKLVGSYPFQFLKSGDKYAINPKAYSHMHPEPLFALVDYTRYFASDAVGVWGQLLPANETPDPVQWGMLFPLKDSSKWNENQIDSSTFNGSPINIYFRIRSVGGSCPMFC